MLHILTLAVASGVLAESVTGARVETSSRTVLWSRTDSEGLLVELADADVSTVVSVAADAVVSPRVCDRDSQNFR